MIGAGLFLIALVAGIVAVVQVVRSVGSPLAQALQNPAYETPAAFTMKLDALQYTVYASEVGGTASISPDDVTVTAPDGKDVVIDRPGDALESIRRGSTQYVGAARFQAPTSGSYQVKVQKRPGGLVVVAPSIEPSFEEVGYWVLAALGAGLVGLVGMVLFIVGLVRRSSARKQPAYGGAGHPGQQYPGHPGHPGHPGYPGYQGYPQNQPGQNQPVQGQPVQNQPGQNQPVETQPLPQQPGGHPPAGWYPDPGEAGRSRYWDGRAWTEHQR